DRTDRINFLSLGMGTVIDPSLTSPSIGRKRTLARRLYGYVTGDHVPLPNPPDTALKPWDGVGDCWCSVPSNAGLAQMAILLGQRAVPEEVVVEHIPKGASPDPDIAPREMELWAQFKPHHGPVAATTAVTSDSSPVASPPPSRFRPSFLGRFFSSSRSSPTNSTPSPSATLASSPLSLSSLHDTILETLHRAYPNEPEAAYSNDALLGPSFFRVGKWQYDRDGEPVQRFTLNAIVDQPTLRVDKVEAVWACVVGILPSQDWFASIAGGVPTLCTLYSFFNFKDWTTVDWTAGFWRQGWRFSVAKDPLLLDSYGVLFIQDKIFNSWSIMDGAFFSFAPIISSISVASNIQAINKSDT
ncbi:hypothetical protein T310_1912, partial [Rasamsonia emersonii CBS 393.64]